MRIGVAIVLCAAWVTGAAADPIQLTVGVRTDATPFSYLTAPSDRRGGPVPPDAESKGRVLREAGYGGYIVGICDAVISRFTRLYPGAARFAAEPVEAGNRFAKLWLGGTAGGIDILCDPSTISQDRVERFFASPPVYLSGVSFATQTLEAQAKAREEFGACAHLVGVVDQTTAQSNGILRILGSGDWALSAGPIRGYLQDYDFVAHRASSTHVEILQTIEECLEKTRVVMQSADGGPSLTYKASAVRSYKSHTELAEAFCRGKVRYYVGDIEIINRKLQSNGCKYNDGALTYSDERYVIFAKVPRLSDGERAVHLLRFYQLLSEMIHSRNSVLINAYRDNFQGYNPTTQLKALVWSLSGSIPQDGD